MALPETASQAEFARLLGYKRSYVTALKQAGRLVLAEDGAVRVAESIERIEATRDPGKDAVARRHAENREPQNVWPKTAPAQTEHIGSSYQAARAVKERYLALEAKRAYEEAVGKLLRADDVSAAVASITTTLRARLESLPDLLAAQLAAESDEVRCRAILVEEIENVLNDAASSLMKLCSAAS